MLRHLMMRGFCLRSLSYKNAKILSTFESSINYTRSFTDKKSHVNLGGILPPVPTPFNKDETIAYDKLKENFEKWNKFNFRGYIVLGSNGEYVYLNKDERIQLVKAASELKSSDKLLIAGAGCESTNETISLCTCMAEVGADAVLVVTPSYFKSGMTDQALCSHFQKVANLSPLPVILYNVPKNTGIDMSVSVIAKLARHGNIIGMKESGGDINKIGNILNQTEGQDFQVLAGSAGFLLSSLYLGCVGGVCGVANVLGKEVCDLYQLFNEGSQAKEEAVALQKRLIGPNDAVTKMYGVPGLKAMLDAKGYFGGPTRSPLQKLSKDDFEKVATAFKNAGFD